MLLIQSCCSKLLRLKVAPNSLLSLSLKIVSENGLPNLFSKIIPQSYRFSKQLSVNVNAAFKAAKLLPTVAPQSCSSKLLPKAASQRSSPKLQCCCPKLPQSWSRKLSKAAPKAVPRRCSPKLCPKAVLQSCCPKAAILQTYSPKRLPKATLQSGS